ncbi:MAG TPA: hypothetical protein VN699_07040 [Pirellulales bacterium]|nr:hypothetical protein [Pirellulales bacterium]
MVIFRRFLVLASLAFWQGGFSFYASVVVPMAEQVLSSPIEQGFVTRRVTNYLNLAGAVALPLLFWDVVAARRTTIRRILPWFAMALVLLLQVWLHPRLDQLLDLESMSVLDQDAFYAAHQVYLISSAFQWLCALAFTVLSLQAWSRAAPPS